MKIAIIGQQDFGKAVLEAFLARGDTVAGVFCAPEKPGARPDALKVCAQEKGVEVFQFPSLKTPEAHEKLKELAVDIGIMAFVLQFAPQEFVKIPKHGTIQYHPSLLPKYPGLDTHARALAAGDAEAGCTVHLVTEGVDQGRVLGQAAVPVLDDDTPTSLAQRVLAAEHDLYPRVLAEFCRRP